MITDNLNLNRLRVFEMVYREKSMTAAARELHLTQSGVSQHIKLLEDGLGIALFDRVKQRLVPTTAGNKLYETVAYRFADFEQALWQICGNEKRLLGKVAIGMPIEFGNNVVIPLLAEFAKKHPMIQFRMEYDFASAFNDKLLSGQLDFAFVDDFRMDSEVETSPIFEEILELCISERLLNRFLPVRNTQDFFERLSYVDYRDDAAVLKMWFSHHLNGLRLKLNVRATVMDVQGVARFVINDLGAGVLPRHVVQTWRKRGQALHHFKGCGKHLVNRIHLAALRGRTQSSAVQAVLAWLRQELNSSSDQLQTR